MRIALNSQMGAGAHFGLRLKSEGHSVDYYLCDQKYEEVLGGLIKPRIVELDHRQSHNNYMNDLPNYSKYDISVFDVTGKSRWAEASRLGCPTIGDGIINATLEDDRAAGIHLMEDAGIAVPPYEEFEDVGAAKAFIRKTGKRYVYKPDTSGEEQKAESTYVSKDAEDMLEYIEKVHKMSHGVPFLLQEFIPGIEVSCEGWFNGTDFHCLNCTLEEKKFMNDDKGPNTPCSGNLVFLINHNTRLFKEGLGKVKDLLAQSGFRGMIDLNTIVTEDKAYGLEWTPRFGYDASHTLYCMYGGGLGHLLGAIATGSIPENNWKAEFGVCTRLSIPPYPTDIRLKKEQGIPIKGIDVDDKDQMLKTYLYDARMNGHGLESAGIWGQIASPVEIGNSIVEAWGKLEDSIKLIQIPDMQYRTDLQKSTSKRYIELQRMGWI